MEIRISVSLGFLYYLLHYDTLCAYLQWIVVVSLFCFTSSLGVKSVLWDSFLFPSIGPHGLHCFWLGCMLTSWLLVLIHYFSAGFQCLGLDSVSNPWHFVTRKLLRISSASAGWIFQAPHQVPLSSLLCVQYDAARTTPAPQWHGLSADILLSTAPQHEGFCVPLTACHPFICSLWSPVCVSSHFQLLSFQGALFSVKSSYGLWIS